MSNAMLAQTDVSAYGMDLLELLLVLICSTLSALSVLYWRLYRLPLARVDERPTPVYLLFTIASAALVHLSLMQAFVWFADVAPEDLRTTEGIRKVILVMPGIQLVTIGVMLGVLIPFLPRALHWGQRRGQYVREAAIGALIAIPWVFLASAITVYVARLWGEQVSMRHDIFRAWAEEPAGVTGFKLAALATAIIGAPVMEELFFRGLLQRLFHRLTRQPVIPIVLASAAFMAIHSPWAVWPPIFVLSLVLGWVYYRTGSVLTPIIMHALFNGMQFVVFILTRAP